MTRGYNVLITLIWGALCALGRAQTTEAAPPLRPRSLLFAVDVSLWAGLLLRLVGRCESLLLGLLLSLQDLRRFPVE